VLERGNAVIENTVKRRFERTIAVVHIHQRPEFVNDLIDAFLAGCTTGVITLTLEQDYVECDYDAREREML
jgi:hypothetical protein